MSNKNKNSQKKVELNTNNTVEKAENFENTEKQTQPELKESKKEKVVEVKAKDVKKKKEKQKKPNKVAKALKDTGNELKKVEWPTFKQVVKQTSVVLAFVIVFALVLFGFDRLCSWLTSLLV